MICPSCKGPKRRHHYLCLACWYALPAPSRRALSARDPNAPLRLLELHRQLQDGVPVGEVRIARLAEPRHAPRPGRRDGTEADR